MQHMKPVPSFLQFLPVNLFGAIMGLTGLSFCWEWAERTWGFNPIIKMGIGWAAIFFFILLTATYLFKMLKYPSLVKVEFQHPVSVSFFATFIISLLLIPGVILPYNENLAVVIWITGTAAMLLFAWIILRKWLDNKQDQANALPAWILPVVGTLDVPIVGHRLPIAGIQEICLFFFAVGILFTLILFPIIISRLLFQPPLPKAIQPTLMIMVGPFALAYSGYVSISGVHDIPGAVLFFFALFMLILFGSKIFLLPKCCPFRVTWWSVSFPLVAITVASFRYAEHNENAVIQFIPAALLTISTVTITYLLLQTFYRLFTNRLFLEDRSAEMATRSLQPAPLEKLQEN